MGGKEGVGSRCQDWSYHSLDQLLIVICLVHPVIMRENFYLSDKTSFGLSGAKVLLSLGFYKRLFYVVLAQVQPTVNPVSPAPAFPAGSTPGSVRFGIKGVDCKLFETGLALMFCFTQDLAPQGSNSESLSAVARCSSVSADPWAPALNFLLRLKPNQRNTLNHPF